MTPYNDSLSEILVVYVDLFHADVNVPSGDYLAVRPVVTLKKSALGDIDDSEEDKINQDIVPDDKDINNLIPSNN